MLFLGREIHTYFKRLSRDLKTAFPVVFWFRWEPKTWNLIFRPTFHSNVVFKIESGEKIEPKMTEFRATALRR